MSFTFFQFFILSCFSVTLLMERVMTSPEVRQRRSDDPSPLEAVVEQLLQVNTLNAEVAALKTAETEVRQKRSDDGGPLEAVVEQLSAQVNHLNAQLTQQANQLNAQLTQQANSFTAQLNSVNAEVAALRNKTDKLDKAVAFYVWNSANPARTLGLGVIILDHAFTNIGNAYDTMTGIFTAPVSGLYDFQVSVLDYNGGDYVHAVIYVDSTMVAIAESDRRHRYDDQATVRAVVHVNAGQRVYLKNIDNKVNEYYVNLEYPYTSFSGFLIKAD